MYHGNICFSTTQKSLISAVFWENFQFRAHRSTSKLHKNYITRNVGQWQRDGRPAEYRWRPLFNAAKFGWCPLLECHAVTLPKRETRWNYLGCPKLPDRSQPPVGRSWLHCEDMWRRYCYLSFFLIVDMCLSCEDMVRQSCAMVPRWRFFGKFLGPAFPASCMQHVSDWHSKFGPGPHYVSKYGWYPICDGRD